MFEIVEEPEEDSSSYIPSITEVAYVDAVLELVAVDQSGSEIVPLIELLSKLFSFIFGSSHDESDSSSQSIGNTFSLLSYQRL